LKELFRYKNERSSAEADKILLISLNERNAGACVTNSACDQLFDVVYYSGDMIDLQSFQANAKFLNDRYPKIVIGSNYEPDNPVPAEIKNWVNTNFGGAMILDQVGINRKHLADDGLYADFKTDQLSIALIKDGELLLIANQDYETSADLLWHFLNICDRFSITPQDIQLKLSGFIEKDSALYKELYQYFLHIDFDDAEWGVAGDYPAHYFRSFNKLARCVS